MPIKQAGTGDICSKRLADHHQGRITGSADICGFQTLTAKDLQPSIKYDNSVQYYVNLSNVFINAWFNP